MKITKTYYSSRVCHEFRLTKQNDYYKSFLTTLVVSIIFEAAMTAGKNWLKSSKTNNKN